jgi:hypothetical protein
VSGKAVIPVWTALSLGIIPLSFTEEHGFVFSLGLPDGSGEPVMVDTSYSGRTTLGWIALFLNTSSVRTARRAERTKRFHWHFRKVTAESARELLDR